MNLSRFHYAAIAASFATSCAGGPGIDAGEGADSEADADGFVDVGARRVEGAELPLRERDDRQEMDAPDFVVDALERRHRAQAVLPLDPRVAADEAGMH